MIERAGRGEGDGKGARDGMEWRADGIGRNARRAVLCKRLRFKIHQRSSTQGPIHLV